MSAVRVPRWALSFADLCLVLLGFFVILHAQRGDPRRVVQGMRAAFGDAMPGATPTEYRATALFAPGEAILNPAGVRWLAGLGRQAATAKGGVLIVSDGMDAGGSRLDGWELAAARVAAVGRAVRAGGLAEKDVTISIPAMGGSGHAAAQTLRITPLSPAGLHPAEHPAEHPADILPASGAVLAQKARIARGPIP